MSASVDQKFETFVEENLSERQVTDGAGKADGMEKVSVPAPQDASIENLGGPTNQNYKNDDNSSKIANKGTTAIKGNAVNKNAGAAEGKPAGITKAEEVETHENSLIKGNIKSTNIDLGGKLIGNINSDRIKIKSTAEVEGVLNQKTLSIEEGASLKIKTETHK